MTDEEYAKLQAVLLLYGVTTNEFYATPYMVLCKIRNMLSDLGVFD